MGVRELKILVSGASSDLSSSPKYSENPLNEYNGFKKSTFPIALASGNSFRIGSYHLCIAIYAFNALNIFAIPIMPGFLYKNQRLGRASPNVEIVLIFGGPPALCPVCSLAFLSFSKESRGPLFLNLKSGKPLHKCNDFQNSMRLD